MNVQVAVLCDAATDDNGKLNLLGAFDTIYTQQLPAVHPQCSIALRVTFFSGDEGKHTLRLHFGTRNFIVNMQQLKFENPGLYSIDVSLDGHPQASVPLLVKHNPPAVT